MRGRSPIIAGDRMAEPPAHRLALIGIDAGDIDFIRASLGELPALRALLEHDGATPLRSPADVLTSAVWPTFATGRGPGEHGAYYPMQWDPERMELRRLSAEWLGYEPFWYELARQGTRVTTLDVPFSLPSRLENGVEIQNWGSQECLGPLTGNRPDLVRAVRRRFGKHPMGHDVPVELPAAKLRAQREKLVAGARKKAELARWLMATTGWELFVTVFGECHRGGHLLWPGEGGSPLPDGALLDVYRAVDAAIAHVLDGIDLAVTTVVVFSTHGMGPNHTQEHFVLPLMERLNATFRDGALPADAAPAGGFNPMRMLRAALPPQLQATVARLLPDAMRDFVVKRAFCGGLDFASTPGFALIGSGEGYLRLNLLGREANGMLARGSDELARYTAFLRDSLANLRDAESGAPLVADVVAPPELYPGPRSELLPDLVVRWKPVPPATAVIADGAGRLTGRLTSGRRGEHRSHGFAVLTGNRAAAEHAPRLADVADFADFTRAVLSADAVTSGSRTS